MLGNRSLSEMSAQRSWISYTSLGALIRVVGWLARCSFRGASLGGAGWSMVLAAWVGFAQDGRSDGRPPGRVVSAEDGHTSLDGPVWDRLLAITTRPSGIATRLRDDR